MTKKIESRIKTALLAGEEYRSANGWLMKINAQDNVEIWPPKGEGMETTLAHLDAAIADFCKRADVYEPSVNQTQGKPPKTTDGNLGKDTSTKDTKKLDAPEKSPRPKPQGPKTPGSLGKDTSTKPGFDSPAVNKRPKQTVNPGDPDLGADSSTKTPNWGDKKVKIQEDGRTGRITDTFSNGPDPSEIYRNLKAKRPSKEMLEDIMDPEKWVANRVFADVSIPNDPSAGLDDLQSELDQLMEKYDAGVGVYDVDEEKFWSLHDAANDAIIEGDRGAAARSIKKMRSLLDMSKLGQMTEHKPKRGPGMPGKGKGTYADGDAGGQLGAGCEAEKEAVAPEGWEETVKKMKKHPEIDNEYALAWSMKNKGYTPGGKDKKKESIKTPYGPDDQDEYSFSPEGRDLFNAVELEDAELVADVLENSAGGIPEREMYYAWQAAMDGGLKEIEKIIKDYYRKNMKKLDTDSSGEPFKEASRKQAGPKLREKWLGDGGYHREIESESAEELHALVRGFGGEEVDWSKFKPTMPEEDKEAADGVDPAAEAPNPSTQTAKKAQGRPDYWELYVGNKMSPGEWLDMIDDTSDEGIAKEVRVYLSQSPAKEWLEESGDDIDDVASYIENDLEYTRDVKAKEDLEGTEFEKEAQVADQASDVEAVDEEAKDVITKYMGDYGKELTKNDGVAPKKDDPKKKLKKGKMAQAETPAPAAPAGSQPSTPSVQQNPQNPAGAKPPVAPEQKKGPASQTQLQPGVGDAGIQALGWTKEDVQSMTDDQKQKILQVQLSKPGTVPKTQAPAQQKAPAPSAPKAPAPSQPNSPVPAPGAEPAPPAPAQPAPKAVKGGKGRKRSQAAPQALEEEAPAPAPQTPAAPAPKAPAAPQANPTTKPGADGGDEQRAFQILQEVQKQPVEAATPNEISTAKASLLMQRLSMELGMGASEAAKLFGLPRGNLTSLFK